MRLAIRHETRYCFAEPVVLLPHRLLLTPRSTHELTILESRLETEPRAELDWSSDVFGNIVTTAYFPEPTDALHIDRTLTIDLDAPAFPVFSIEPCAHAYPFDYSADDQAGLGLMTQPAFADPSGALRDWAKDFVLGGKTDTLSLLKDINSGILAHVTYRTRDEAGTQTPSETLQLGSGSCRDIAALFIDAVRRLGFGARAISGYLFDPDPQNGDAGSTHAWAEVYLPGAGWITFDPTHQRTGSACLIPVAVGYRNEQIMPVSGGYTGDVEDFVDMEVRVSVEPLRMR